MAYREENDQVVLTMSRDDFQVVLMALGAWTATTWQKGNDHMFRLLNRLNEGNPHYTPYRVSSVVSPEG